MYVMWRIAVVGRHPDDERRVASPDAMLDGFNHDLADVIASEPVRRASDDDQTAETCIAAWRV